MYTITITKTTTEQHEEQGSWTVVEQRPYTEKELSDVNNPERFEDKIKDIFGYTPTRQVIRSIETQVYEQTVEAMQLAGVILAVNNMLPRNGDER